MHSYSVAAGQYKAARVSECQLTCLLHIFIAHVDRYQQVTIMLSCSLLNANVQAPALHAALAQCSAR